MDEIIDVVCTDREEYRDWTLGTLGWGARGESSEVIENQGSMVCWKSRRGELKWIEEEEVINSGLLIQDWIRRLDFMMWRSLILIRACSFGGGGTEARLEWV